MRLLDKLVMGTFLRLFVAGLAATPPMFVLADVTESLDRYIDRGLTTTQVAGAYLYMLPTYIQWSFPIAALIAAVFTVHNMTAHREVVAAKAGGISFHRLVVPILGCGAVLMVVALGLSELSPRGWRRANQILRNQTVQVWRTDFVYQTEGGLAISARRLTADERRMSGIVVQRRDENGYLHVEAEDAVWRDGEGWLFVSGHVRYVQGPDSMRSYDFQRLRLAGLDERPEDLLESPREDEEMTYAEIKQLASIIQRSGGEPHKLLVKQEQKLAIPIATLIIVLFGMPLATSSKRGGTAYGIGVSLGSTLLYLLLLKIAAGFGASGAIPPFWAAWLPNLLFLAVGLVLMTRVRT
jgi:lipopolysaccharide export system permease protein